jgi:RimJ/RimL family protein N-acetyltransferase
MGTDPPRGDRAWMDLQLSVLFRCDARGRIEAVTAPGAIPQPRVFLGRTLEGNLWRVRADLPADLAREAEAILASEPVAARLDGAPPASAPALRELLSRSAPVTSAYAGPAFRFPEHLEAANDVVVVDETNADLLNPGFPDYYADVGDCAPYFVRVVDGRAVAICHYARRTPEAAEAGVDTLEEARRRGHASAVTRAWAASIRASGGLPLYSTQWTNTASRGVARRLGLIPYGEDWHLR